MESQVILFSGKQGAGKTAVFEGIKEVINQKRLVVPEPYFVHYLIEHFKYAEPMYRIHDAGLEVLKEYGLPVEAKEGMFLQDIGYWGVKRFGSGIWARLAAEQIVPKLIEDAYLPRCHPASQHKLIIINDDCRRPEEFDAFPDALKIRLTAPREIRKLRATSWREDENHPSETALDEYESLGKFNLVLRTDGPTVKETASEVLQALKGITGWIL